MEFGALSRCEHLALDLAHTSALLLSAKPPFAPARPPTFILEPGRTALFVAEEPKGDIDIAF